MLTSLPLPPPQPAPPVSTRPGPPKRPVPNVLRTATRSETGPPPASATQDSSALTPTLPPCPAPVRTHTRAHNGPMPARRWQAIIFLRAASKQELRRERRHCLRRFAISAKQRESQTCLECHLCFAIPLFVTQPPSTSCLGAITEDVEK